MIQESLNSKQNFLARRVRSTALLLPTMLRLLLPLLGAASAAEPKAECNCVNDTDYFGPALGALRAAAPRRGVGTRCG